jgi:hypothetical protein
MAVYFPKWVELLIALYNTPAEQRYCGCLKRKTGITLRHLRTIVADLADMHFVVMHQNGNNKIKYIDLTEQQNQVY